ELAAFAGALFELQCAKKGDHEARANMLDTADRLLQFWRDHTGDRFATSHPALQQLWPDASAMLVAFDAQQLGRTLNACWKLRGDAAQLQKALLKLETSLDRRVEFAACLYHLELARLGVDGSRAEFARRIHLVHQAYRDAGVAAELVGGDQG